MKIVNYIKKLFIGRTQILSEILEEEQYCPVCEGTGCDGWQDCWNHETHVNCDYCNGTGAIKTSKLEKI